MYFCELTSEEYNEYWNISPYKDFLSSVDAMELKQKNGWNVEYVGIKEDDKVLCATVLTSIPVMKIYRFYYAQRGFLIDYKNQSLLHMFSEELKKYLKQKKCLYLRFDPNIFYKERDIDGNIVEDGYDNSYVIENLKKEGFKHYGFQTDYEGILSVNWIFSLYLDGKDEKTILKEMHQQTRWSVNKTIKQGIKVRELSIDEIDIFNNMMYNTAKRRNFEFRGNEFYKNEFEAYKEHSKLLLAYLDIPDFLKTIEEEKIDLNNQMKEIDEKLEEVAKSKKFIKKKKVVQEALDLNKKKFEEAMNLKNKYGDIIEMSTALFLVYDNEIIYLHSATDEEFKKYYAPYAIQWYMIQYALNHKIPKYNFYGISGDFNENAQDYGVYEFKKGFNGVVEQFVGDFYLPIHKNAYNLYKKLKG